MTGKTWYDCLDDVLNDKEKEVREELRVLLKEVMASKRGKIEQFAHQCIVVSNPNVIIEGLTNLLVDENFLKNYFAAIYFANALYFEREVDPQREKFEVIIDPKEENALYRSNGPHQHKIILPPSKCCSLPLLLFSLDSEIRHAIHQGIQQELGTTMTKSAERVFHVISELIDLGKSTSDMAYPSSQFDPFLNDMEFLNEKNGHEAARFFGKFLSHDPRERQRQLLWLASLPIRPKVDESDLYKRYIDMVREFCIEGGEIIVVVDGHKHAYPIYSSFIITIERIKEFYAGNMDTSQDLYKKLFEARVFARTHFPYIPPNNDSVSIGGKRIKRFVSQLAYIALKLSTTEPRLLYKEAKARLAV